MILPTTPEALSQSALLWTLLAAQIFMGGFDIVFHHEITERLGWKPNAADELRLHAARNALYALLFGAMAWLRPSGLFAAALVAVLLIEIVITLWDFVEEDRTRKLPPTERVLHTLLAINYGGILVLVVPVLVQWAGEPTALLPVSYGIGSAILSVASLGCVGFALRDLTTSRRAARLAEPQPPRLDTLLTKPSRVLVAGATGFIGSRLVAALTASGHEVIALVRDPTRAGHLATPITLVTSLAQIPAGQRIDAVVNLAGEPVAAWPWTRTQRTRILQSRIETTRRLGRWMAELPAASRPTVYVAASAIGFYGDRGEETLSEADATGTGFAAEVCRTVESEAAKLRALGPRVVALRIGLVMSIWGGPLGRMVPPFDLALGGRMGSGRQWWSWIGRDDLVRLIAYAIASPELDGAVNATAPQPLRNGEVTAALARGLHRPAVLPVPAAVLRLLGDMGPELFLASQRVAPVKALASGFSFQTPTFEAVLASELGTPTDRAIVTGKPVAPVAHRV